MRRIASPMDGPSKASKFRNPNDKAMYKVPAKVEISSDAPVTASFDSSHLTIGAGVAIFHLASSRVVLCWHSVKDYWFLPKGRRDVGEETGTGAEREGFEESGYRNRLLPIALRHRQPHAHNSTTSTSSPFVTEPVWTQLVPVTKTAQYMLFWYIAETLPCQLEEALNRQMTLNATENNPTPYQIPPSFPPDLTFVERMKQDPNDYEPLHHPNTGVDSEEAQYRSYLLPIDEATAKLKGTIQKDVVKKGWQAICLRQQMETG